MTLTDVGRVGITDEEQDRVTESWTDVFDRALQTLSMAGFDQPTDDPVEPYPDITPDDYVNLEGDNYTRMMAKVDYWFNRAKHRLGWVEAELICRESEFKDVVRGIKNALREDTRGLKKAERPTETELKEQAESYPYPRSLAQRITELKANQLVLTNCIEGLERFASGLSRQITLREQDIHLTNQMHRGGRKPQRFT